jgi:hypothetical protein
MGWDPEKTFPRSRVEKGTGSAFRNTCLFFPLVITGMINRIRIFPVTKSMRDQLVKVHVHCSGYSSRRGMFGLIASGRLVQTNWEQAHKSNVVICSSCVVAGE